MRMGTRALQGVTVVEPYDRITLETQPDFTAAVRALLDQGHTRLVLNLEGVPYIDSCGLGAIAQAYVSARRRGGDLKLLHVAGRNRRLLSITKLLTVFEALVTEAEIEDSFAASSAPASVRPRARASK